MWKNVSYELIRGLAYLRIKHVYLSIYRLWTPLIMTIFIVLVYNFLPMRPNLIGSHSVSEIIESLLPFLLMFYLITLIMISTFNNPMMDREISSPAPQLKFLVRGDYVFYPLTRRLFLNYLFSYLSIISSVLFIIFKTFNSLTYYIYTLRDYLFHMFLGVWIWGSIEYIFGIFVCFLFCSMITATLHGMYFLMERIHQP